MIAENVMKFLKGSCTWAEVEEVTAEQAGRYMNAGAQYLATGRFEEAERLFFCLTELNPKDADAHALLGTARQAQEKHEEAIAAYTRAIAVDPKHVVALAERGELRRKQGDAGGLDDLKRAAEIDPMGNTRAGARAAKLVRALAFHPGSSAATGKPASAR